MILYEPNGTKLAEITVDDNSYRHRAIMGDNTLTLYFSLPEHLEIPIGTYTNFQGTRYTLIRPEALKMKHSRCFEYTVTMEGADAKAKRWKFRNPVDGRLKFPLTATPREHLQMFVDNMNKRDSGWSIGSCIEGVEQLISYNHNYCLEALQLMAQKFDTEYEISGKVVSLRKVEYNKNNPLALSYGKGNGFKSGVGRSNSGDSLPVEILYVQGGTDNINPTVYGSPELLLPKGQTLGYDGNVFSDQAGYVTSKGRTYTASQDGLSIQRSDKTLDSYAEDSLDCSTICPKRVGTISSVVAVDTDKHFYDIIDSSIPFSLDYNNYLIAGETMTVIFQSGMLAGREFEAKYIHEPILNRDSEIVKAGRRFEIVPQDIDGQTMPNETFKPVDGNTYAVFHCALPDAYVRDDASKSGASWDMFREAIRYMYEHEEQQFTFKGELDGIWAKQDWENIGSRIVLGGYIEFSDDRFQPDGVLVRIVGIKDYINNPHSPIIELSNQTITGGFSSALKELENEEVTTDQKISSAVQFTKRRYRDALETISALKDAMLDFSEGINPVTVQTMAMLVGDESLQFRFVNSKVNPQPVNHAVTYDQATKVLSCESGILQHMTLGIDTLASSHAASEYKFWDMSAYESAYLGDDLASKKYYLYAKVSKTAQTGVFVLSQTAIGMDSVAGYYHLLVGILNSEFEGTRSYVPLYGFTEVLPGRITTDKIVSPDGLSYFDLLGNSARMGGGSTAPYIEWNKNSDGKIKIHGAINVDGGGTEFPALVPRGEYSSTANYYWGDLVTFQGSTYLCFYELGVVKNEVPTNTTYWRLWVSKGDSGVAQFKSIVFKRTNSAPATPTGGSYERPVPSGWSDGVPSGEQQLWMSTNVFCSDGTSTGWTTPRAATDTADIDFEFSAVETNPGTPSSNPSNWHNTATASDIWMAVRKCKNGTWGSWEVSKIKGEQGNIGPDGQKAPYHDFTFGISAYTSASGAPSDISSWSDTPPATTSSKPYLWCRDRYYTVNSSNQWVLSSTSYYRLTGEAGAQGKSVAVQWSANGTSWHDTYQSGDKYMRERVGDGSWSAAIKVVGEDGRDGQDGANGSYTSFVFKNSWGKPDTPIGPNPIPAGWSDSPESSDMGDPSFEGNWTVNGNVITSNVISHNQQTWEKIKFKTSKANAIVKIKIAAYSENNYDWGFICKLDTAYSTSNYLKRVSGLNQDTATITVAAAGEHYIYVGYTKDSSRSDSTDQVIVEVVTNQIWMSKCSVQDGVASGDWTVPVLLTGANGVNGNDGQNGNLTKHQWAKTLTTAQPLESEWKNSFSDVADHSGYYLWQRLLESTDGGITWTVNTATVGIVLDPTITKEEAIAQEALAELARQTTAEKLGYSSWEEFSSAVAASSVLIQGGRINASLIDTELLIAKIVKTSMSGKRVEIDDNEISIYDSSENLIARMHGNYNSSISDFITISGSQTSVNFMPTEHAEEEEETESGTGYISVVYNKTYDAEAKYTGNSFTISNVGVSRVKGRIQAYLSTDYSEIDGIQAYSMSYAEISVSFYLSRSSSYCDYSANLGYLNAYQSRFHVSATKYLDWSLNLGQGTYYVWMVVGGYSTLLVQSPIGSRITYSVTLRCYARAKQTAAATVSLISEKLEIFANGLGYRYSQNDYAVLLRTGASKSASGYLQAEIKAGIAGLKIGQNGQSSYLNGKLGNSFISLIPKVLAKFLWNSSSSAYTLTRFMVRGSTGGATPYTVKEGRGVVFNMPNDTTETFGDGDIYIATCQVTANSQMIAAEVERMTTTQIRIYCPNMSKNWERCHISLIVW